MEFLLEHSTLQFDLPSLVSLIILIGVGILAISRRKKEKSAIDLREEKNKYSKEDRVSGGS